MATRAIKDNNGQVLPHYLGSSRIELGCRVMPARCDAFRLHVSASYRELFERALQQVLQRNGWRIVQIKLRRPFKRAPSAAPFRAKTVAGGDMRREWHEVLLTDVKAQVAATGQSMSAPNSSGFA
jgi:hypothetical protein